MNQQSAATWERLRKEGRLRLKCEGLEIEGEVSGKAFYLATPVFVGTNYLPHSVRRCLQEGRLHAVDPQLDVTLTIDEARFRVLLILKMDCAQVSDFESIVHDFAGLAHEWKRELDERGQEDLIYAQAST